MLHLGIPGANATTKEKRFRQVWQLLIETQQLIQSIFKSLNLYMKNSAGKMPANSRGTITTGTKGPQKDIIKPNVQNMAQLSRGNDDTKMSKQECCLSNNQSKHLHLNSISRISDLTVFKQTWDYK
jgi:hypothetical protein